METDSQSLEKPRLIIHKSLVVVVLKLIVLQAVFMLTYFMFRLVKNGLFGGPAYAPAIADSQFWLGMTMFLVLATIQMVITAVILLQWGREQYVVREDSIVHTRGVMNNREEVYSLRGVEAGKVRQGLLGRLLNFGTVSVFSPVLKKEYFLYDIPNPEMMKRRMLALLQSRMDKDEKIIPIPGLQR